MKKYEVQMRAFLKAATFKKARRKIRKEEDRKKGLRRHNGGSWGWFVPLPRSKKLLV